MSVIRHIRIISLVALTVAIGVAGLAGCRKGSAVGTPSATPATSLITVDLDGGGDGVNVTVTVAQDGSWVYIDRRTSRTERGMLTATDLAQLRYLVSAPGFAEELLRTPGNTCPGGYLLTVTVGARSASFTKCDGATFPKATDAVGVLAAATPLFDGPTPTATPDTTPTPDTTLSSKPA